MNQKGASIISVLILIGVSSAIMFGLISMVLNQNKESLSVSELIIIQDFESSISAALSDKNVCSFIMQGNVFNSTQATGAVPYTIDIGNKPVYASMLSPTTPGVLLTQKGHRIHPSNSTIKIESIRYELFPGKVQGTTGLFYGQWIINFDTSKAIRRYKPIVLESSAVVDMTDPLNAIITNCFGYNRNAVITQNCAPGMALVGYSSTGAIKCKSNHPPNCPAGQIYSGMDSQGGIRCVKQIQIGSCPSGQVMTGIYNDLTPQCRDL